MSVKITESENGYTTIQFSTTDMPTDIESLITDLKTIIKAAKIVSDAVVQYDTTATNIINKQIEDFATGLNSNGISFEAKEILAQNGKYVRMCSITHAIKSTTNNGSHSILFNQDTNEGIQLYMSPNNDVQEIGTLVCRFIINLMDQSGSDIINVKLINEEKKIYEVFIGDCKSTIIIGSADYTPASNDAIFAHIISKIITWTRIRVLYNRTMEKSLMSLKYVKQEG